MSDRVTGAITGDSSPIRNKNLQRKTQWVQTNLEVLFEFYDIRLDSRLFAGPSNTCLNINGSIKRWVPQNRQNFNKDVQ